MPRYKLGQKPSTPYRSSVHPVLSALTPRASTPRALTPRALTPRASTPRASTPRASTPRALTPRALTPRALTPRALTPRALTPRALTPRALTPRALNPYLKRPSPFEGKNKRDSCRLCFGLILMERYRWSCSIQERESRKRPVGGRRVTQDGGLSAKDMTCSFTSTFGIKIFSP